MQPHEVHTPAIAHPWCREILADLDSADSRPRFIRNYAEWVLRVREVDPGRDPLLFLGLALLARRYWDQEARDVAASLAALARLGLPRPSGGVNP